MVIYFNSCQVHNDPLLSAIMSAGTRTYIGGILSLLIGPSEKVFKCFWNDVLTENIPMETALFSCEANHYPISGAHGIAGDVGQFKVLEAVTCFGLPCTIKGSDFPLNSPIIGTPNSDVICGTDMAD